MPTLLKIMLFMDCQIQSQVILFPSFDDWLNLSKWKNN